MKSGPEMSPGRERLTTRLAESQAMPSQVVQQSDDWFQECKRFDGSEVILDWK